MNQALVFYHFASVVELVSTAARAAADERVAAYRPEFDQIDSLPALLELGRSLHDRERAAGNVRMMAQLMSGAQQDEQLADAAAYAMRVWSAEIEVVVRRVLTGSPLTLVADPVGLARAIAASFIGLQLFDGVDADGAESAMAALEQLGVLVEVMDDLGPVARRALERKVRKQPRKRSAKSHTVG